MTDADKELERLAKAATPGPWTVKGGRLIEGQPSENLSSPIAVITLRTERGSLVYDGAETAANASYIAAANPQAVLALIERLRELEMRRVPTHRCRARGALWISYPDSWSLFSKSCGKCCDNTAMSDQIEPLDSFDPSAEKLANENGMLRERVRELEAHVKELEEDVDQKIELSRKLLESVLHWVCSGLREAGNPQPEGLRASSLTRYIADSGWDNPNLKEDVLELLPAHDAEIRSDERKNILAALETLCQPNWGAAVGAAAGDYPELAALIKPILAKAHPEEAKGE